MVKIKEAMMTAEEISAEETFKLGRHENVFSAEAIGRKELSLLPCNEVMNY